MESRACLKKELNKALKVFEYSVTSHIEAQFFKNYSLKTTNTFRKLISLSANDYNQKMKERFELDVPYQLNLHKCHFLKVYNVYT